jgi:hypothetical protein
VASIITSVADHSTIPSPSLSLRLQLPSIKTIFGADPTIVMAGMYLESSWGCIAFLLSHPCHNDTTQRIDDGHLPSRRDYRSKVHPTGPEPQNLQRPRNAAVRQSIYRPTMFRRLQSTACMSFFITPEDQRSSSILTSISKSREVR